jgi:hypothetical protein
MPSDHACKLSYVFPLARSDLHIHIHAYRPSISSFTFSSYLLFPFLPSPFHSRKQPKAFSLIPRADPQPKGEELPARQVQTYTLPVTENKDDGKRDR